MEIRISNSCFFTELDEKGILLDTSDGIYYEFDDKAAFIWKMLMANDELQKIKKLYSEKFQINDSESNEFINEFIDDLKNKGFLT